MMPDDVDPVVPDVVEGVLHDAPKPKVRGWERMLLVGMAVLLVLNVTASVGNWIYTVAKTNSTCHSTQDLRAYSSSDRQAQDDLDKAFQDYLMSVPPASAAQVHTETVAYQNFLTIRTANETKRAQTNGSC